MQDYDVIVIGSGIGGLISAGILVSRGLKILLIEKNVNPGGYLVSFQRGDFVFDAAVDCFSGVENGGLINNVLKLLGVDSQVHFVRVDPVRVSIFPDMKVAVDSNMDAYKKRLMSYFPLEGAALVTFFKLLEDMYIELQTAINMLLSIGEFNKAGALMMRLGNMSYLQLLNDFFTDAKLKSILSDRCTFVGLSPSKASALTMAIMMLSYFKFGAYRPVGGSQKLADALVEGIRNKGGRIIFGSTVQKILLKYGKCVGIRCENGDEYTSKNIISNVDFVYTFNNLIGGEYEYFAKDMLNNVGVSTSYFILYAGIKGDIEQHSSIGSFPSYRMETYFRPDRIYQEDATIGITIASIEDKTRAPAGSHTVVLHEMVQVYDETLDKAHCTKMILKKAERILPHLTNNIVVMDAATPETLLKFTGNYHGSAFGWKQIPGFRGIKGPEIKNLYIAGHWGGMGGGVLAAAYSGARAAGEILTKEGIQIDI
ncbi:MAG: NAD(P)/FAD-dependent oxidoreductase [Candidatus Brocadia sp.]|nr:NAD(P)/FAD-dependent oxidoreductase [Candidatus Brocadia sp.]